MRLHGIIILATSLVLNNGHGIESFGKSIAYLQTITHQLDDLKGEKCKRLSVFSVLFSKSAHVKADDRRYHVNSCFFLFMKLDAGRPTLPVLHAADEFHQTSSINVGFSSWVVLLNTTLLPFKASRRNVKFIKMNGAVLFPEIDSLLWMDAKLGAADKLKFNMPQHLHNIIHHAPFGSLCALFIGLPNDRASFPSRLNTTLSAHAQAILDSAAKHRRDVTDSPTAVQRQMRTYGALSHTLDHRSMADTAFIYRNFQTQECRDFNVLFDHYWLMEIARGSDRDQLSFPYVLHQRMRISRLKLYETSDASVFGMQPNGSGFISPMLMLAHPLDSHWYYSSKLARLCRMGACKKYDTDEQPNSVAKSLIAAQSAAVGMLGNIQKKVSAITSGKYKKQYYITETRTERKPGRRKVARVVVSKQRRKVKKHNATT